jgi:multicomponent Na+:H+ antiporter subunit B
VKGKALSYVALAAFAALLVYASFGLPNRGDASAALNGPKSLAGTPNAPTHYIQNPERDAATANMVTVILADYRGYDTMGEETVILTAGLICFLILRRTRNKP